MTPPSPTGSLAARIAAGGLDWLDELPVFADTPWIAALVARVRTLTAELDAAGGFSLDMVHKRVAAEQRAAMLTEELRVARIDAKTRGDDAEQRAATAEALLRLAHGCLDPFDPSGIACRSDIDAYLARTESGQ